MEPRVALRIEETVARLDGHLAALRELVVERARRFAAAERLDVRQALADHLHDDARCAAAIAGRIEELGGAPGAGEPDGDLAAALRDHLGRVDPFLDEPTLRLLTEALAHHERHAIDDGGVRHHAAAAGEPSGELVQRLIAGRIEIAARAAQEIAADPDAPAARHLRAARRCWDAMRHAAALERVAPWTGAAEPLTDLESVALPGHEELRERMLADDRRHARETGRDR